jgi:hypothetical protein
MNPEWPGEVAGIGSEAHLKLLAQIRDSYRVGRIKCEGPISGTLMQDSRFSVPDIFFCPDLEPENIRACIQYAIHVVAVEDLRLATTP